MRKRKRGTKLMLDCAVCIEVSISRTVWIEAGTWRSKWRMILPLAPVAVAVQLAPEH